MVDWSKLPDLGAVGLLTAAFAAVARRSSNSVSGLWLTGWVMILLHFAAFLFSPEPGWAGDFATFIGLAALAWAGILFMWASVPYRADRSSASMLAALLGATTLYLGILSYASPQSAALTASAILIGLLPLAVALNALRTVVHPLRWITVALYAALACFLVAVQHRPGNGPELALNALFFTVYLGCCLHFWYVYRRLATGALITTAGFFAWASVFVVGPALQSFFPAIHLEDEVWNLPKYVVAVGMILLLLEEQIEHNKHLALHDELTGLPNRRLFQDRLASALERARRTGAQTALLLIDLDHFKQVNDTIGHHIGDLVLKRVAQVFSARVRRSDTVARTGGDEFSIILEEPTSRPEAELVGHSLIDLLNQPFELEGHDVQIGASVGIAVYPQDAPTPEALCIAADLHMYARKYQSRGKHFHPASAPALPPHPPPPAEARPRL
ncbi:MAG: diguanylate cyclase domain-containing protein [Acidobacteriota bacterium]